MSTYNLAETQIALIKARKEQAERIARRRELETELQDLGLLIDLGARTVARLSKRQSRAITGRN